MDDIKDMKEDTGTEEYPLDYERAYKYLLGSVEDIIQQLRAVMHNAETYCIHEGGFSAGDFTDEPLMRKK